MDMLVFDRLYDKSVMCCELVMKMKQYTNILEVELSRLNNLQLESNQLLDTFYAAKNEFEFIINEMLQIKYTFRNKDLDCDDTTVQFSNFLESVCKIGKHILMEKQKKLCYVSVAGCPLAEVFSTINSFIGEVMHRLTYMPYHSGCTQSLRFMSSQIAVELQVGSLNTADACFRQCCYLKAILPFQNELNNLVYQYILQPNVFTPKQFVDKFMFQIPSIDSIVFDEDCEEMAPFRMLVDLLNGKLLNRDFLDQHSEIRPVVDDDTNLKKSRTIREAVNWIVHKTKIKHDDSSMLPNLPLMYFPRTVQIKKNLTNNSAIPSIPIGSPITMNAERFDSTSNIDLSDIIKPDWTRFAKPMPYQPKFTRKGRKSTANNVDVNSKFDVNRSNDLQPINLHAIQTPLLAPLL